MARASGPGENWRRWESCRERALGSLSLIRLKNRSAWERCSLEEDIREEIRVSNWAGSGLSRAASWACSSMACYGFWWSSVECSPGVGVVALLALFCSVGGGVVFGRIHNPKK